VNLATGDRAVVTGAAGFIGSRITRQLLDRGLDVVALLEPGADRRTIDGLDVETRTVDVRDRDAVIKAVSDARVVFHTAALYRFWARDPALFYDVNVGGTLNVIEGATRGGVEKVVYTSTVGTLGLHDGHQADETSFADVSHLFGGYKRSKYVAEHEVLRAAAQGLPVSLVMPTFPLGPGDRAPTPTGQLVLDFLNGKIPGYVDTALNVAHVDDVAAGHILAAEQGATGRSYILGGENKSLQQLLADMAASAGLPAPRLHVPRALAMGFAHASEFVEGRLLRRQPFVPLEAARMSTTTMVFDDARARTELGYAPRPAKEAIRASVEWFVDTGMVTPRRRAKIHLSAAPR
jgi:dihydroflavonol-4-reductase